MKRVSAYLNNMLNIAMALSLSAMAILVFGNVVLRYAFNSGITWSEEMSRFLFIWLTFIGAIGAFKENQHLGMDAIIKRLPDSVKKVVYVISSIAIFYILWLLFDGSLKTTLLNTETEAPATGLPMAYIYGIGIVASVSFAVILFYHLIRVFCDKHAIDELTRMKESEEEILDPANQTVTK